MKREIKFRVWDGEELREVDLYWFEETMIRRIPGTTPFGGSYEVMQFTGLKDCKGKMIYESDIVTCEGFGGRYKVVYEGCAFVGKHIESDMTSPIDLEMQTLEVIGNVYENPELL